MNNISTKPFVLALMGIPGAGKTSLALWLSQHLPSLRIVSRDVIREAMFSPCLFTNEEKTAAFEAVKLAIPIIVSRGDPVVIDGMCFSEIGVLEEIEKIALTAGADPVSVFCNCPLDVAIARVERDRESGSHSALDRDAELVKKIYSAFRPLPQQVVSIKSDTDIDKAGQQILSYLSKSIASEETDD